MFKVFLPVLVGGGLAYFGYNKQKAEGAKAEKEEDDFLRRHPEVKDYSEDEDYSESEGYSEAEDESSEGQA